MPNGSPTTSAQSETSNSHHEPTPLQPNGFLRKTFTGLSERSIRLHRKIPLIRALPPRAVGIILLLIFVNAIAWTAVGIVTSFHHGLAGTAILAWTLGLRHALDADHISAIDLMTRRLVAANQRPVTVGTFFSLGHSTIVIITSIVVAATAATISNKWDGFAYVGGIVGSSISAAFLLILGLANAWILALLIRQMQKLLEQYSHPSYNENDLDNYQIKFEGGGCFFRLSKKLFRLIDRPWKMYPLGVVFGLGFDTSSQIALLGISAVQSTKGTSLWLILLFPLLFTVGMCLVDTTDGALMLALYTIGVGEREKSTTLKRDTPSNPSIPRASPPLPQSIPSTEEHSADHTPRRPHPLTLLYYNVILTALTIIVALTIGVIQLLGLVDAVREPSGAFWNGLRAVQDRFDVVGGVICGMFAVAAVTSVVFERKWRRRVLGRARERAEAARGEGLVAANDLA